MSLPLIHLLVTSVNTATSSCPGKLQVMDEAAQALTAFLDRKAMTQCTLPSPLTARPQLSCQATDHQSQSLFVSTPTWAQHSNEQLFRQAVAFISLADFLNSMTAGTKTVQLLSTADEICEIIFKRVRNNNDSAMAACVEHLMQLVCGNCCTCFHQYSTCIGQLPVAT